MAETIIWRAWAMPNGNTFDIPPIRALVTRVCRGADSVIDPFANKSKIGTVTNDLNPEFDTTYNMDALEFLKIIESNSADVVLYDPPYSITQAKQLYNSYGAERLSIDVSNMGYWAACKNEIARIVKRGGRCVSFGWNSNGLGISRGFIAEEIVLVAHGGSKNDTIVTVERKADEWAIQPELFESQALS